MRPCAGPVGNQLINPPLLCRRLAAQASPPLPASFYPGMDCFHSPCLALSRRYLVSPSLLRFTTLPHNPTPAHTVLFDPEIWEYLLLFVSAVSLCIHCCRYILMLVGWSMMASISFIFSFGKMCGV